MNKRIINIASLVFFLIILSSCKTIPRKIEISKVNSIKSLAVVSLLGSEMEQVFITTWSIGGKSKKVNVEEWHVDQKMPDIIQTVVGKSIKVLHSEYDREAFIKGYYRELFGHVGYDSSKVKGAIKEIAKRTGADAVIIVADYRAVPGYGSYRRYGYKKTRDLGMKKSFVWAVLRVDILDGATQKLLATKSDLWFNNVPWEIGDIDNKVVTRSTRILNN